MSSKKTDLAAQLEALRTKLKNLTQETEMQSLLRERDELVAEQNELAQTIREYLEQIRSAQKFIRKREVAEQTGIPNPEV